MISAEFSPLAASCEQFSAEAVRSMAIRKLIPRSNLSCIAERDHVGNLIVELQVAMAAHKDTSTTRTIKTGDMPSSLGDWLKFYVKNLLGRFGARVKYRTTDMVTNTTTEYWNVCPHTSTNEANHFRFMSFGGDFRQLNEELRHAANEIVQAAVEGAPAIGTPNYRLMHAVRRYLELAPK